MMIDGGLGAGMGIAVVAVWAVWLLFIGAIVALIILAIRWFVRQERGDAGRRPDHGWGTSAPQASQAPLEILRERYARGEIDDEEYERRRKLLTDT